MPLLTTLANGGATAYGMTSSTETLGGMRLITPTSITSTGAGNSSSIGSNGSVTFTSCATLSLNGVFTSRFDNYVISVRCIAASTGTTALLRLRASGTDATGIGDYINQNLLANGTLISASRDTGLGYWGTGTIASTWADGLTISIYYPYLAQYTAFRSVDVSGYLGAYPKDAAGTHAVATSYDGFTIYPLSDVFTGRISVYGLVGA